MFNEPALQDRFGPRNSCFGCGPSNPRGLQIKSHVRGDDVIAEWKADTAHEAFPGVLCGGIIGTLLDCHSNWAAAWHLMNKNQVQGFPYTVTAEYTVKMLKPTPTSGMIHLRAWVVESSDRKATVEAELSAGGAVTAICKGIFVAVKEGHVAHGRW